MVPLGFACHVLRLRIKVDYCHSPRLGATVTALTRTSYMSELQIKPTRSWWYVLYRRVFS